MKMLHILIFHLSEVRYAPFPLSFIFENLMSCFVIELLISLNFESLN